MLNNEIWKTIQGFAGRYQVSNLGRIRTKRKVMKPFTNNNGYDCIKFAGGAQKHFLVHRLVAEYFVQNPNPFEFTVVNHKDFNRRNNIAENLEWCTTRQNLKASRDANRMPYNFPTLGKKLGGQRRGTSTYHGVFRYDYRYKGKIVERWRAYLCVKGKRLESKSFPSEIEAARYYDFLLDKYQVTSKPRNFIEMPNDYPEREYNQAVGNGSRPDSGR